MTDANWVGMREDHRHRLGRLERGPRFRRGGRKDHIHARADQLCRELRHFQRALRPAELEAQVSAFQVAEVAQAGAQRLDPRREARGGSQSEIADARELRPVLREREAGRGGCACK